MKIRTLTAWTLALLMAFAAFSALGEAPKELPALEDQDAASEEAPSAQQIQELKNLDEVTEQDDEGTPEVGAVYLEKTLADFSVDSPAIYTAKVLKESSLFAEKNTKSKRNAYTQDERTADVLYVGSNWAILRFDNAIGWIKRNRIHAVSPIDPTNTPPYGAQKHAYVATTATTTQVRKSMSSTDDSWVVLNPGTKLSIWRIQDGWAVVNYWRTYGYIDMHQLTDLIPVSPTDTPINEDTPIAAYTSYYSMSQDDVNKSRIVNINVGCERLTGVLEPGASFDFNGDVGPYRGSTGYQKAWVLVNGKSVPGYGGGTCQVSSTLYNALLQLPKVEVLQRRPHGPDGARYLPHGVDAAVGNNALNLRFRNNYDFPVRIEGHTAGDGALLMLVYRASNP